MSETKMIVGLGNPGEDYANTRHNVGFKVIDLLAEKLDIEVKKKNFGGCFGTVELFDNKLILLKPMRYMNCSGQVVVTAAGFYKLAVSNLLVITDDMALEPGTIRIRGKGSDGGHNGLADIIEKLGTQEINRLRIGIGRSDKMTDIDYVLGKITAEEKPLLNEAIKQAGEAVICWVKSGAEEAMNRFNLKNKGTKEEDKD
jgi:peptidyl-tRNA hydrolase, PTH1 family